MNPADRLMKAALSDDVFPGGVLLVAKENAVLFHKAYGYANLYTKQTMTRDTIFDLASLTKPLATTLAVMKLVLESRLTLSQRLGELVAPFRNTEKAQITIKQLLAHTSGLPDYRPYYKTLGILNRNKSKSALRDFLVKEPFENPIGKAVVYSDLGFMVLSWVIEAITGKRLDHYVRETIYRPLGLKNLFFVDLALSPPDRCFAATENCPWRNGLMEGVVHDENAYAVDGIEGHAGLFGSAQDVYRLLRTLLSVYHDHMESKLFQKDIVRLFFRRQKGSARALGFDTPSPSDSSCGRFFSRHTVGHLGFTGTSFWMDLDRSIIVVLLTNRVHTTRENEKIKVFRPKLHDAVMMNIERCGIKEQMKA